MQKPRFLAIILLAACTGNVSSQAVFGSFGGEALSGFSPGLLNRNRARLPNNGETVVQGFGASEMAVRRPTGSDATLSALNLPSSQQDFGGTGNRNFANTAGSMDGFNRGSGMGNSVTGNDLSSGGLDSTGGRSGYGNGYGGDDDGGSGSYGGGGANAGYGGYPGRGGYSGYWEPGVKPVPLAMQGWGLFLPRPPVEITTPTTVAATTARPVTAAPTTSTTTTIRPLTPAPTPAPTTATTTRASTPTTSSSSYSTNSGGSRSSGSKGVPQVFMINGQRVLMMPVNVDPNQGGVADRFSQVPQQPVRVPVNVMPSGPPTCTPASSRRARGTCVADTDLQTDCSNMIIANSDTCASDQFCCFAE